MPDSMRDGLMKYEFTSPTWKYPEKMAWHFVSLPVKLAGEIRGNFKWQEEGWGRLTVKAKIGGSEWETAIWFDTKHETYLLPVKAAIRKKEKIELGQNIKAAIWL